MQGQPSTIHSLDQSHSTCTSWTPSSRHEVGVRILNSLWRPIELLRSVATLPPLLAGSSSKNHKTTPWDGARRKELTASLIQDRGHPGQTQHLTIRVCFVGRSRSNNRLRRSLSWRIGIGDRYSSLHPRDGSGDWKSAESERNKNNSCYPLLIYYACAFAEQGNPDGNQRL